MKDWVEGVEGGRLGKGDGNEKKKKTKLAGKEVL